MSDSSKRDSIIRELDSLIERLGQEALTPESSRRSKCAESDVLKMKSALEQLRATVAGDHLPAKGARYAILARIVADEWPLGDSLGREICEVERHYQAL